MRNLPMGHIDSSLRLSSNMHDFLHYVIASIVDDIDAISISEDKEGDMIRFDVKLAEGEYGKVIGKGGKTINAIKTLLYVYQTKQENTHNQIFINIA